MPRVCKFLGVITLGLFLLGCKGGQSIEIPTKPVQPDPNDKPVGVNPGSDGGALTSPKSGKKPAAK
jgi:hypothetical protein